MRLHAALTVLLAGACHGALLPRAQVAGRRTSPALGRREATSCGLAAALVSIALPSASWASGGATSGKTTSIPRAKLRYYDRITAVVTSYQGLEKSIAAGNTKNSPFWAGDQPPYDELKTYAMSCHHHTSVTAADAGRVAIPLYHAIFYLTTALPCPELIGGPALPCCIAQGGLSACRGFQN